MTRLIIILAGFLLIYYYSWSQQTAFPGAEGYGKYTKGGRGGVIYEVTNLKDRGKGSLRAAVKASGPRTVVFRVSGNIVLNKELRISNPYITIAGQTAPGEGICISKYPMIIDANEVIIRYIRLRLGDESGESEDALSGKYRKNIIIDHVSASWSVDETMSIYHCDSLTVQWCIISESLYNSNHYKGPHGYGGIWGGNYSTYHHNLFAHHSSRNPRFTSGAQFTDFRNNVIYNWGYNSSYGGEAVEEGHKKEFSFSTINMVANYYKPGPATQPGKVSYRIINPTSHNLEKDYGKWYVIENYMQGNDAVTKNNWNSGVQPSDGNTYLNIIKLDKEFEGTMKIKQETAEKAFVSVLNNAGATLPARDSIDIRIINDTRSGTATFEGIAYKNEHVTNDPSKICGIIDSQNDVGGWPQYKSTPAPADTDHDGMPDDWEEANALDKNNSADRNSIAQDGYTMLEKYLNSIH